jgi:hypothetical protein
MSTVVHTSQNCTVWCGLASGMPKIARHVVHRRALWKIFAHFERRRAMRDAIDGLLMRRNEALTFVATRP